MWRLVEATSERAVLERNPYYWKVDTAGNQPPYGTGLFWKSLVPREVVTMRTLAGQYDFTIFHLDPADYPTLVATEEAGGYRALLWKGAAVDCHLKFNLTYDEEDPVMAEILRTPEFPQGPFLCHRSGRKSMSWSSWGPDGLYRYRRLKVHGVR